MASNATLIAVKNHSWMSGFGNIFRKEAHAWWGTWSWLIQIAIWLVIVNGMMAMVSLAAPRIEAAQARQEINQRQAQAAEDSLAQTALMVFFVFSSMAPAVGVVIIAQDALIGEKQSGTAAWVLSKPISRAAFILSKISADVLGILVTMVLVQGAVGYFIYYASIGTFLPVPGWLAALGLQTLLLLFYLSLTYMLGTLFRARGPVIGIPMVLIFGNQLVGLAPFLGNFMPWNLLMDLGPGKPSLAIALVQGQPLPTVTPIIGTVVLIIAFIAIGLWRFQREEL